MSWWRNLGVGYAAFAGLALIVSTALADDSFVVNERPEEIGECTGLLYKSKKDDVPVYAEADKTSEVIARLSIGEVVCYVGEQDDFAVLHWRIDKNKSADSQTQLAYSRLVDLWPSDQYQVKGEANRGTQKRKGFMSTLKSYYYYMRSGGVPEDGLAPYRHIIDSVRVKPAPMPTPEQGCNNCDKKEPNKSSTP
jgi:hypothetical protein